MSSKEMELTQENIFKFLPLDNDPVYQEINSITERDNIHISELLITKNQFGIYEVESPYLHENFNCSATCYKFVCSVIEEINDSVQIGED